MPSMSLHAFVICLHTFVFNYVQELDVSRILAFLTLHVTKFFLRIRGNSASASRHQFPARDNMRCCFIFRGQWKILFVRQYWGRNNMQDGNMEGHGGQWKISKSGWRPDLSRPHSSHSSRRHPSFFTTPAVGWPPVFCPTAIYIYIYIYMYIL